MHLFRRKKDIIEEVILKINQDIDQAKRDMDDKNLNGDDYYSLMIKIDTLVRLKNELIIKYRI